MNEFEGLKEGDNIFEQYGGFASITYHLTKVTRVTKTQIIIGNSKYRYDGSTIGCGSYSSRCIRPYNASNIRFYEIQEKRAALQNLLTQVEGKLKVNYLPENKLDKVSEILTQLKAELGDNK